MSTSDLEEPTLPTVKPGEIVRLGEREYTLEAPASIAMALDLLDLSQSNQRRAQAGALLLCSPKLRRVCRVTMESAGHSASAFGGAALDALLARKAPPADVYSAGLSALLICLQVARTLQGAPAAAEVSEGESGDDR